MSKPTKLSNSDICYVCLADMHKRTDSQSLPLPQTCTETSAIVARGSVEFCLPMADVLSILRDAVVQKKPIDLDKDSEEIVLGAFRFPKDTLTSYKKNETEYYTV